MKHLLLLALTLATQVYAENGGEKDNIAFKPFPNLQSEAYVYRDTCKTIEGRFAGTSPFFLVYPDTPCDSAQAAELVAEIGLDGYVHDFSGTVCVMNPVGSIYDNEKDFEAYKDLINHLYVISNLKVIGIGAGATFVNSTVAKNAGEVAGIVSIGGKPSKAAEDAPAVPAFIAGNGSKKAADPYIRQNDASLKETKDNISIYANADEPLQQVVVSQKKYNSLKETIEDAWDCLLCKNYRFNNYRHTWYTGAAFSQYGPYELEPYIMPEDLGIDRRVIVKNLLGTGDFLWYEYHPKETLSAAPGTVPLVLLLHGNNNDPRTQAETSGFVELCAEENFVVAELEWQGNGYAPMGLDGIEQVVYYLLETYPQLDASRVYAEGLSAGAATATGLGIRKSHLFAAVGAQSAGIIHYKYFGYNEQAIMNEARQKRGWVEMPYFSVTGTLDEVVPFVNEQNWGENAFSCAWQAYQTLNDLEVSTKPDFSKDAVFGIELQDRETIDTNKHISVETGVLCKGDVPLVRLAAINDYGHWNFKPDARMMWDFFKHFSRDVQTGKLIFN